MTATEVDVLVIGLGPAGASAAAAAARAGLSVLAVDRKAEPGIPVQCAEFVPALLDQGAACLGVSRRQAISAMETYVEAESADRTPDFRGTMISRAAFDRHLVFEAEAAGAACRFATPLRAIAADGTVSLHHCADVRARVLIGADGPRSAVGRAIGRINRDCVESRQIGVPLRARHQATDIFLSAEFPGGYGWLFPKNDTANLGLGVAPRWKRSLKPALANLHARLVREGRVGLEIISHTGGPIPVGGLLDPAGTLGETAVLLAGDAAGLTNPITGAGIPAAVMSGEMAGKAAAEIAGGKEGAAASYREELEDIFGPALSRALRQRRKLLAFFDDDGAPSPSALRAAWIAYPEYWAAPDTRSHA